MVRQNQKYRQHYLELVVFLPDTPSTSRILSWLNSDVTFGPFSSSSSDLPSTCGGRSGGIKGCDDLRESRFTGSRCDVSIASINRALYKVNDANEHFQTVNGRIKRMGSLIWSRTSAGVTPDASLVRIMHRQVGAFCWNSLATKIHFVDDSTIANDDGAARGAPSWTISGAIPNAWSRLLRESCRLLGSIRTRHFKVENVSRKLE
jgi:hypothetical protein